MNPSIFNSACYTVGWFWCILWGIQGKPIIAVVGALVLALVQIYNTKFLSRTLFIEDFLLAVISIPLGILLEMFFLNIDIIRYANSSGSFPPVWIIALYPLFVLQINHALNILKFGNIWYLLFGFLCAPISYIAGSNLGGLTFHVPITLAWIILGISWGLFLCLLGKLADEVQKIVENTRVHK